MEEENKHNSITIQMLPARNGDCFLVSIQAEQAYHILIDTGFDTTFEESLKEKLRNLNAPLDLCIITHIDNDHIGGAIRLFEQNGKTDAPKIIEIKEVWHNSFRHVHLSEARILIPKDIAQLQSIIDRTQQYIEAPTNEKQNISGKQGSSLAAYLLRGQYAWNKITNNEAICVENLPLFELSENTFLQLLSPNKTQLQKLEQSWKKELYKSGFKSENFTYDAIFDDAVEFLGRIKTIDDTPENISTSSSADVETLLQQAFRQKYIPDNAVNNGSSIAFILVNHNKKILFAADAFAEVIEESLRRLYPNQSNIYFDAYKVSHHGSKSNNSPSLIALIATPIYLFSSNGKGSSHSHPDWETLARIIFKPTHYQKQLHFNYEIPRIALLMREDLQQKYNYKIFITNEISL